MSSFLILSGAIAFYVAWNLGANDVANSMGTSVGSKAVTLRQALAIAAVFELSGAVLFGQRVSSTLAGSIIEPTWFETHPQVFLIGMIAVLISCGIWLQIATAFGLPVASSHAVVGAIAGIGWVAVGKQAVNWQSLGLISATWVMTPVLSGSIAAGFYGFIRRWVLVGVSPIQQLYEWIPWLSSLLVSIFGVLVLPALARSPVRSRIPLPDHTLGLAVGAVAVFLLTIWIWHHLTVQRQILNANDAPTLHSSITEGLMARFQLVSACFVAFAHGSNDVGNAVAPLAAIAYIHRTQQMPTEQFPIPLWVLLLGGVGIVAGLSVMGKHVIHTVGESLISLQPSSGFCAELATATTILLATHLGLPVSTSHALVGAVVGIGLVQRMASGNRDTLQLKTLRQIALAWFVTLPISVLLAAGLFAGMRTAGIGGA